VCADQPDPTVQPHQERASAVDKEGRDRRASQDVGATVTLVQLETLATRARQGARERTGIGVIRVRGAFRGRMADAVDVPGTTATPATTQRTAGRGLGVGRADPDPRDGRDHQEG